MYAGGNILSKRFYCWFTFYDKQNYTGEIVESVCNSKVERSTTFPPSLQWLEPSSSLPLAYEVCGKVLLSLMSVCQSAHRGQGSHMIGYMGLPYPYHINTHDPTSAPYHMDT